MGNRTQLPVGWRSSACPVVLALISVAAIIVATWTGYSWAWSVSWTVGALSALAGTILARRHAAPVHRARWTWWSAAAACWVGGQAAWGVQTELGVTSSPNVADLAWWCFAIFVVCGLLRTRDGSRAVRIVAIVEVVPLIAAAMAMTFAELWDEAAASSLPAAGRISALVYPAVYVSAAVVTLQAMVGGSLRRVRGPGARLVLVGIVAQAVAFIAWSGDLLAQHYVAGGSPTDPLWAAGLLAIGLGGVVAAGSRETVEPADDQLGARGGVLPAAVFVLLVSALVRAGFGEPPLGARLMLAAGLLTCGTTLIARSVLLGRRLRELLNRERLARRELAGREAELAQLNERLRRDVRRDPMTGLRNRRALAEDLPVLEALARSHGEVYAVALCDVDRFKAYNDHLGHLAGDQALRRLAATMRGVLRAGDAAYRYGGEELLLLLRSTDADAARVTAERVRSAVLAAALPHPVDPTGVVTVSIGVAAGASDGATLLARADAALYQAKRGGRNQVVAAVEDRMEVVPEVAREAVVEEPVLRQLRGMLAVSRAAACGRGALPVLEAVAQIIRSELRFQTVAVNLREGDGDDVRVVLVEGDEEARAALHDTVAPWASWEPLFDAAHERAGAIWVPAGSHEWDPSVAAWTPAVSVASDSDGWHADDELFLPLRRSDGDVLGLISVGEPLSGRRPDESELRVLMAVADHAGLALEQAERLTALPVAGADEISRHRLAAVMLLAETLDLRDAGTAEHSRTVGVYARETAAMLGLGADRIERLHAAGVLHDLGKLGVPDAILHKPSTLDPAEWREIQRHPEVGARILEHSGLADIAAWVRAHHERMDGRGYPAGLQAAEIPLEARVLAVADAYEAMVADRPYRPGMAPETARLELLRCAGTQFDPEVVGAFLRMLERVSEPGPATAALP
jgi:diguanylate cyclase (GGDEF)-like protein